jgi:uncharacterized FlaG/YvyC family protein
MKTFRQFQEQLERGDFTPNTPAQTQQQRDSSVKRASMISRKMRSRSDDELDAHQSNMRTLLKKSGEDIRGAH